MTRAARVAKSIRVAVVVAALLVAGIVGVALVLLLRPLPLEFEIEHVYALPSPSGRHVARVYTVVGPRARRGMRVGIQPAGDPFDPALYVMEMFLGLEPCLSWSGDGALTIEHPKKASRAYLLDELPSTRSGDRKIDITYRERSVWDGRYVDGPCPGRPDPDATDA